MLTLLEQFFLKSWWVILYTLTCFGLFEWGVNKIDTDFDKLNTSLQRLQHEQLAALSEQEELRLQINSESDPAWVELILMRSLGMVPEGQTKYYFSPKK